ncbi:hypothetical protein KSI01_15370 [Kurthia sibirica]|nr:hypothetical protein KSI01_15370 [Kurthia sibirica]
MYGQKPHFLYCGNNYTVVFNLAYISVVRVRKLSPFLCIIMGNKGWEHEKTNIDAKYFNFVNDRNFFKQINYI